METIELTDIDSLYVNNYFDLLNTTRISDRVCRLIFRSKINLKKTSSNPYGFIFHFCITLALQIHTV